MVKVITYGTYDMLHFGHIRLLQRARALGDYLIVGITAEDFDKNRGKINVKQSLMERIEAVRATGLADKIVVEEYEGQKIDDIKRYDVDIFTVGSDWAGKFDYLNEYCRVVYLERTKGVSSSELRSREFVTKAGLVTGFSNIEKYIKEASYVNGIQIAGAYTKNRGLYGLFEKYGVKAFDSYEELLENVDALYLASLPEDHYAQIDRALDRGRHVLCETPVGLTLKGVEDLFKKAKDRGRILMEANKTAYAPAYNRLLLLAKSGRIGKVVSVDVTCTSLEERLSGIKDSKNIQNSICGWGSVAMLPVFQLLGTNYKSIDFNTLFTDEYENFDLFTRIDFLYDNAVATVKVGKGVKSEGELVISGTGGYIYVPAPWWKTDYFEIRYEDQNLNKRYFYQLDGEGIRYELVTFVRSIANGRNQSYIDRGISEAIAGVIEKFNRRENVKEIHIDTNQCSF